MVILCIWLAASFIATAFMSRLFTHNRAMHEAQRRHHV